MATAPEIKQVIEWVLKDFLGTYTYPNGFTRQAVSIGNTLGNVEVSGLEVIIPVFGNVSHSCPLSNGTYTDQHWRIIMVQRDNNLGNLGGAIRAFLGSRCFIVKSGSNYTQQDPTRTFHAYTALVRYQTIE